ncbi:hypothetical protein DUI87_01935 [Hirundo rustica rustica]|uniref:Integrase-type domain-containing protein n=1 Tax=Hirundo rustica rustica TaxID=333673 RepID=A0A3M0L6T7_HIRRU|nr:hypothetical protein DUI87_01935 [Hirundo rustica rustica]
MLLDPREGGTTPSGCLGNGEAAGFLATQNNDQESIPGVAPVVYTGKHHVRREYLPFSYQDKKELCKMQKTIGRSSEIFKGMMKATFNSNEMVLSDIKDLFRCLLTPSEYDLWEGLWKKALKTVLQEIQQTTDAQDSDYNDITHDHLCGEGDLSSANEQIRLLSKSVLDKICNAAEKTFYQISSPEIKTSYVNIKQISSENFLQFLDRLRSQVERQVQDPMEDKVQRMPPWKYLGLQIAARTIVPQKLEIECNPKTLADLHSLCGSLNWAKLSHQQYHQNVPGLIRQFQLTRSQARAIVATCPNCQVQAMPSMGIPLQAGEFPAGLDTQRSNEIPDPNTFRPCKGHQQKTVMIVNPLEEWLPSFAQGNPSNLDPECHLPGPQVPEHHTYCIRALGKRYIARYWTNPPAAGRPWLAARVATARQPPGECIEVPSGVLGKVQPAVGVGLCKAAQGCSRTMSAIAYMDFMAAQCLVSNSNHLAMPKAAQLKVPGEEQVGKDLCDPHDAWKDYCILVTIAESLPELNKYQPLRVPSVCSGNVKSPDEDVGSDSDMTTEPGSSPACNSAPGQHNTVPFKEKLVSEKRHKCP